MPTRFLLFVLACAAAPLFAQPAPPARADPGRYPARRVRPYRANNDLLYYHLDVRVDPEKKYLSGKSHDSLQDAAGRPRASNSICTPRCRSTRFCWARRRSNTSAIRAPSSSTFPRRCAPAAPTPSISTTPETRSRPAGSAPSPSGRIPRATPGSTPPAKASAPASGGRIRTSGATKSRAWKSASRFPTSWWMSPTASSWARRISATATRAGTGSCSTRSTTTTSR